MHSFCLRTMRLNLAAALIGATALHLTPALAQTDVNPTILPPPVVIGGFSSGADFESVLIAPPTIMVDQSSFNLLPAITGPLSLTTDAALPQAGTTITIQGGSIAPGVTVTSGAPLTVNPGIQMPTPGQDVPLAPLATPDLRDDQEAVAYQINVAHTGAITFDRSFGPRLKKLWSQDAPGPISYPLIAAGKVFVTVADRIFLNENTTLYALDKATGAVVWQVRLTESFAAHAAYDRGQVFVASSAPPSTPLGGNDAILRAFDAKTGALNWSVRPFIGVVFASPPTAANGVVYVSATDGRFFAIDERNGNTIWTAPIIGNNGLGSPALSYEGVFVTFPCEAYKFDPRTGAPLWHINACHVALGVEFPVRIPAYYRGSLYVRDDVAPPEGFVIDATSGQITGNFLGLGPAPGLGGVGFRMVPIPAFQGDISYIMVEGALQATALDTGEVLWRFAGEGDLNTAPLIVNDTVYIGSISGKLYALDRVSGRLLATNEVGASFARFDTPEPLVTGLAAGEGVLVAPAVTHLVAFGPADDERRDGDDN